MPTQPDYLYIPIYGVEEYDALGTPSSAQFGGGAKSTNDNLMVSLWADLELVAGIPLEGQLVKPVYAFGGDWFSTPEPPGHNIYNVPNVGWKSALRSRVAARFFVDDKGSLNRPFMAFLQPPQELRQMLSGALSLDADGNVVYQRPMLDLLSWSLDGVDASFDGAIEEPSVVEHVFSGFFSELPYYVGDGSNGVFPTPLPILEDVLLNGVNTQPLIDALRSGAFSVACLLFPVSFESQLITIQWPHSIGRA
jgi:hypothetical protein